MTFERNLPIYKHGLVGFAIYLGNDPALQALAEKHAGQVHVRVSKPVTPGTEEQNRAMHSLLKEYYVSGFHSAPEGCTLEAFKLYIKIQYGPCHEMDYQGRPVRVPKSWADYTKQERSDLLNGLISEIHQTGAFAACPKLQEIIAGMESEA